jgi:hypothetical protein
LYLPAVHRVSLRGATILPLAQGNNLLINDIGRLIHLGATWQRSSATEHIAIDGSGNQILLRRRLVSTRILDHKVHRDCTMYRKLTLTMTANC